MPRHRDLDGCPDGLSLGLFLQTRARRVSVQLGVGTIRALYDIAEREGITLNDICAFVDKHLQPRETFAEALRSYVINYFRTIAPPQEHAPADSRVPAQADPIRARR